jgi:hypothetical protein
MKDDRSEFVGPGKLFETEEEKFAEYIELMEWATQVSPEEIARFCAALRQELARRAG